MQVFDGPKAGQLPSYTDIPRTPGWLDEKLAEDAEAGYHDPE
jgi:hypothetical protein